jgi:hypothetical protein
MSAANFAAAVRQRAAERCEYCQMHQSLQGATFHIEHIVASSRGGLTELENLALCCPSCNLHKSDRSEALDPETNKSAPLFHPRQSTWQEHFAWDGYLLRGLTATGRATITALKFNSERRLMIRKAEERFQIFPRVLD